MSTVKNFTILLLFSLLLVCGCVDTNDITIPVPVVAPEINLETNILHNAYIYHYNFGDYAIQYDVYRGVDDYLKTEDHTYIFNSDKEVYLELFENETNNKYMEGFVDRLESQFKDDEELVWVTTSLVQNIKYDYNMAYDLTNIDPYGDFYYPYETLYNNRGVCSDKSILLAYILREYGYDVVLFDFKATNHMGVGLKTGDAYDYQDTGYAYIETTIPSMITYDDESLVGNSYPDLIHVTDGGYGFYYLEDEYNDMKRLKEIDAMPTSVPEDIYDEWMTIVTKYGMTDNYL